MRNILFIALILVSLTAYADTYYVATTGDNADGGSITDPWLTIDYGIDQLSSGDTLYIRGGTYTGSNNMIDIANTTHTWDDPTVIIGYPEETVILDAENTQAHCLNLDNCFNFHFENLTLYDASAQGMYIEQCGRISYKFLISHDHEGAGIVTREDQGPMWGSYSDSYDNGTAGEDLADGADGFVFGAYVSGSGHPHCDTCEWNVVGLRSWNNTDDGGDMWQNWSTVNIDSSWFFVQPYDPQDNGIGLKLGGGGADAGGGKRRINNCVFLHNSQDGLDYNNADSSVVLYNCLSMYNLGNGFTVGSATNRDTVINCVAIENDGSAFSEERTTYDVYNSWNGAVTATTADFVGSLDSATLVNAMINATREASGTLPDLTNLELVEGSDLIDAGTDVGIDYSGTAPDMGSFEYIEAVELVRKVAISGGGVAVSGSKILYIEE